MFSWLKSGSSPRYKQRQQKVVQRLGVRVPPPLKEYPLRKELTALFEEMYPPEARTPLLQEVCRTQAVKALELITSAPDDKLLADLDWKLQLVHKLAPLFRDRANELEVDPDVSLIDKEYAIAALRVLLGTGLVYGEIGPHNFEPKNCPTFYDHCRCTVECLEHNIERAERAEKELKRLKNGRPKSDSSIRGGSDTPTSKQS